MKLDLTGLSLVVVASVLPTAVALRPIALGGWAATVGIVRVSSLDGGRGRLVLNHVPTPSGLFAQSRATRHLGAFGQSLDSDYRS